MKKRMLAWILAVCLVAGLLPMGNVLAADEIHTPTAMKIIPDENCITNVTGPSGEVHLYLCNGGNRVAREGKLPFDVQDQDGRDISQYVTWSSNQTAWLSFEDAAKGVATVPETLPSQSAGQQVIVTAHFHKGGERDFEVAYPLTVVPPLSLSNTSLKGMREYEKYGLVLQNGTASWSMKSKVQSNEYTTYDLFDMTVEPAEGVEVKKPTSGLYWLNGTAYRPGIYTVTLTEKWDKTNQAVFTAEVSGVAVEDAAGNRGMTLVGVHKTAQLVAFTATASEGFQRFQGDEADVTWTSDNEEVASVEENGLVTAHSVGVATITATDNVLDTEMEEGRSGSIQIQVIADDTVAHANGFGISFDGLNHIYDTRENAGGSGSTGRIKLENTYGTLKNALVFDSEGKLTSDPAHAEGNTWYLRYQSSLKALKVEASLGAGVTAELWHNGQLAGALENGAAVSVEPVPGHNKLDIKVKYADGTGLNESYSYDLFLVTNPTNRVSAATVVPTQRPLSTSLYYNGQTEGKPFVSTDGKAGASTTLNNATVTEFLSFLSQDISSAQVKLDCGDKVYGRIAYKLAPDGPVIKEGVTSLLTDALEFGDQNELKIYVLTMPALAYAESEKEDPWTDESVQSYTYILRKLPYTPASTGITDFALDGGTVSGKDPSAAALSGYFSGSPDQVTLRFQVPEIEGLGVYKPTSATAKLTDKTPTYSKGEDGWYTGDVSKLKAASAKPQFYTEYLSLQFTDPTEEILVRRNYTVNLIQGSESGIDPSRLPTKLTEYLCVAGMHTNINGATGTYDMTIGPQYLSSGMGAERTLFGYTPSTFTVGSGYMGIMGNAELTLASLGNFGGNITYYFEDGIQNDPKHPYGVDFVVYGYANDYNENDKKKESRISNAAVYVSENGTDWYELAGSEHYDSSAVWNYSVTYSQGAGAAYTDCLGRTGDLGAKYPLPVRGNYPLYQGDFTFTGTLLLGTNGAGETLVGSPRPAAWGYHGLRNAGAEVDAVYSGTPNPYTEENELGNGFDLSWAVDKNGLPVKLDTVHYVKVMSNNLLVSGHDRDDVSPVVGGIVKTVASDDVSAASLEGLRVTVDGQEIALQPGQSVYAVSVGHENFTVHVTAPEEANVYINNQLGASRSYQDSFDFEKGILRIVVQSGNSEAAILYIQVENGLQQARDAAKAELRSYKDPEDYREAEQAELASALEYWCAEIEKAEDVETVQKTLADAKAALDAIETSAQLTAQEEAAALAQAKETAKKELENYKKLDDYRAAEQEALLAAMESGKNAIEKASTLEEVAKALTDAKAALDAIKTDAQLTAEENQGAIGTPETGDLTNLSLLAALCLICLSAMTVLLLRKKQRQF